jgi:hypothetical protein
MRSRGYNFFYQKEKKTHDPILFPPDLSNDSKGPISDDVERFVEIQEGRCAGHGWSLRRVIRDAQKATSPTKGCAGG